MGRGEDGQKTSKESLAAERTATEVKEVCPKEKEGTGGVATPPDGGWGWVVVAASFLCNMVLDGIGYSYGILLNALMIHFGEGKGLIALVGSVLAGVILLVGPIASALVNKFGTRLVCIAGAVISSLAMFVSTYSPNVPFLMAVYGVIGGFGLGLMYVPAVVAVGFWFEKRRSLVTGISTCGSGAGTIVFAPLVTMLEKNYGWQGCNRILSALCLACVLFGATMKPVPVKARDEEDSITELKKENQKTEMKELAGPLDGEDREDIAFIDGGLEAQQTTTTKDTETTDKIQEKKKEAGVMALLKNPAFMMIMLGNLPAVMGLYIPYMFLPAMSQERGLTADQASILISFIGAFNTAGRVISGAVTDHPRVDALFVTCFALFFGAVCPFLMSLCTSYPAFIGVSIFFGAALSAWPAVTSSMLVDLLGLEYLTTAFGVLTCIRGLAAFLGPPLGGLVVDLAGGNYNYAFWISGSLLGTASLIHAAAFVIKRRQQAKQ